MTLLRRGFKAWCERAAVGYRRDLDLGPDSPLDPRKLAQHLSITIWAPDQISGLDAEVVRHLLEVDVESWSAVTLSVGSRIVIISNKSHSVTRQNSNLAHEMAHIILKHPPNQMFVTANGKMMMRHYNAVHEEEAGCLSGALLVPRGALLARLSRGASDAEIACYFDVSLELLKMRKNVTGVIYQLGRR